jgi:hypothetical protein
VLVAAALLLVGVTGATTRGFILNVRLWRKNFGKHNLNAEPLRRDFGISFKNSRSSFDIDSTDQWLGTCLSRRCLVSGSELH